MSPIFGSPKPFLDPSRGDAEAAKLRKSAQSGDWRAVDAAFAATTDRSRREFLADAIAMNATDLRWTDAWIREKPESAAARALWGQGAVQLAWQIRSGKPPEYVSAQQFKGFEEWLGNADEQLRHATAMDPTDSVPWVGLLWCAVGLGLPLGMARERWENAVRVNPTTELAALAYSTCIGPRWNGSAETMWDFIHQLLAGEDAGSPRWVLVPHGHLEQFVAARMHKDPGWDDYFKPDAVRGEIADAYARYLGSPARRPSPLEPQFRELFACCLYLTQARELARRETQKTGPNIQNLPWAYFGPAVETYEKLRKRALA